LNSGSSLGSAEIVGYDRASLDVRQFMTVGIVGQVMAGIKVCPFKAVL